MNIDIMFPIQIIPTQFLIALKNKYEQMAKKKTSFCYKTSRESTLSYISRIFLHHPPMRPYYKKNLRATISVISSVRSSSSSCMNFPMARCGWPLSSTTLSKVFPKRYKSGDFASF